MHITTNLISHYKIKHVALKRKYTEEHSIIDIKKKAIDLCEYPLEDIYPSRFINKCGFTSDGKFPIFVKNQTNL